MLKVLTQNQMELVMVTYAWIQEKRVPRIDPVTREAVIEYRVCGRIAGADSEDWTILGVYDSKERAQLQLSRMFDTCTFDGICMADREAHDE